jgi:hypothetical protein
MWRFRGGPGGVTVVCVTVTAAPPIVSVAVRVGVFEAPAEIVTVPVPDPLALLVMVNHDALLAAVQVHPVGAVTVIEPVPPGIGMVRTVGVSVDAHGAPACVTATVCPAMVSVAVRDDIAVFAAAVTFAPPLPDPVAPLVNVNHAALLVAVHVHAVDAATPTAAVPPAPEKVSVVADTV